MRRSSFQYGAYRVYAGIAQVCWSTDYGRAPYIKWRLTHKRCNRSDAVSAARHFSFDSSLPLRLCVFVLCAVCMCVCVAAVRHDGTSERNGEITWCALRCLHLAAHSPPLCAVCLLCAVTLTHLLQPNNREYPHNILNFILSGYPMAIKIK